MARSKKHSGSRAVVWVILVLLIIGLAGFSVTNFGGRIDAIGKVGDREIGVQRYARELQNQINAYSAQIGTNLTLAQAQSFGIDRAVLQQLVSTVAIENEAAELGLSAGDEQLRAQILTIQGFQGLDGKFDREAYRFALQQSGLNEAQFEETLRAEIARTMVQGAVAGGVVTPAIYTKTLVDFVGERRNFGWTALGSDALETPIAEPTDADLQAFFKENEADYMLPETRDITYVWLTPDMIVDTVEIDETALRALYDERIDEFQKPERRLVERLILGAGAATARARLDSGEISFEDLVAERGLDLGDIDLGDVTREELGRAGDAVFGTDEAGIVGPVDTDLGAALFRINAVLGAQVTTFEDARAELVDEFALDRARRIIADKVDGIDDLLAGGATLEELADETELQLGQIDWSGDTGEDIAAYDAFRAAAAAAETGDFPEVSELDDGGIFALRVNEIVAPRLQDFADARPRVDSGWRTAQTVRALGEQARALAEALKTADPESLGLTLTEASDVTRTSFIADTPPAFLETVFDMQPGDIRVIEGATAAYLVRLDSIAPPDPDDADLAAQADQLAEATARSLGADILQAYSSAVVKRAGISINQAAVSAVHTQFP